MVAKQETSLWAIDAVIEFQKILSSQWAKNLLLFPKATAIGLVDPNSQWLFLITDQTDASIFLPTVNDGENVAFLFNTSSTEDLAEEQRDNMKCVIRIILKLYIDTLHQVIRAEETRYFQTTEDDWNRSKPSATDRNNEVYRGIKVLYNAVYPWTNKWPVIPSQRRWIDSQNCSSWLSWGLQAVEMKVTNQPTLLNVGQWDALHGLVVYDDLFPHFVGGLRQRVINVTTVEVIWKMLMHWIVWTKMSAVTVSSLANLPER